MDYYLKATTNYSGVQDAPIFRKISYDMNADETIVDQKIIGKTVVECHTWRESGDHAEAIYNTHDRREGSWEVSSEAEFNAHVCNRWREPK